MASAGAGDDPTPMDGDHHTPTVPPGLERGLIDVAHDAPRAREHQRVSRRRGHAHRMARPQRECCRADAAEAIAHLPRCRPRSWRGDDPRPVLPVLSAAELIPANQIVLWANPLVTASS